MEKTIIQVVVGNMIKVMKSGKPIIKHREAFNKIRHGDYDNFIKIIDEPIPTIVIYNSGVIKNSYTSQEEDSDFAGLLCSGPSLIKFHNECLTEYGTIKDDDITDEIFEKMVLFELSIRMHANNSKLLKYDDVLEVAIDKLSEFKRLTNEEKEVLHKGRIFINGVKHNKLKFPSWSEGNINFVEAYNVLVKNQLTIF
jgi:hypothetical protein